MITPLLLPRGAAGAALPSRRGGARQIPPQTPARPRVTARFLPSLLRELFPSASASRHPKASAATPNQPVASASSPSSSTTLSDADYEVLLEKGRAATMDHPDGQLQGRAGRRCTLEDGERYLSRACAARPSDLRAHLLLLRNLMRQAMGREREVPGLALQALRQAAAAEDVGEDRGKEGGADDGDGRGEDEASGGSSGETSSSGTNSSLEACSADLLEDPACVPALQLVLLALKALHAQQPSAEARAEAERAAAAAQKRGEDPRAASEAAIDEWRARRLRAFVEAAGDVVPGLRGEFARVERRLRRQLAALGPPGDDARARALVSRTWLSAVDLAPPCGVIG